MNAVSPRNPAGRVAAVAAGAVLLVLLVAGWAARSLFVDSLYREKMRAAEFAISPDGKMIYYGAVRAEADIWIVGRK